MSVSSRIRMQVVRSVAPEAEGSASTSTASTSAKLGSHTTGVADSGRWSTRRIAMYAPVSYTHLTLPTTPHV